MYLIQGIFSSLIFYALMAAVLFGVAGRTDLPAFWTYLALVTILSVVAIGLVYRRTPDLIAERMRPGPGERDRSSLGALIVCYAACWIVAGLDAGRYHWSGHVPAWVEAVGLTAVAVGFAIVTWAMVENPYFSSAVRIQEDRGQQVITSGPYHYVRHPGYTGGLLFLLCTPIGLGSWLAVLPMLAVVPFIVNRIRIEDRMLQAELAGYPEYAQSVRYRLIPGVW